LRTKPLHFIRIDLRAVSVVPAIGRGHARLECAQLFFQLRNVKETSAVPPLAPSSLLR